MSGEKHDRDLCADGALLETAQRVEHGGAVCIRDARHLKAEPLERGCDILRIVGGIRQGGDVGVGAVADNERDAALRAGRIRRGEKQQQSGEKCPGGRCAKGDAGDLVAAGHDADFSTS
jgi:hypothetical protein